MLNELVQLVYQSMTKSVVINESGVKLITLFSYIPLSNFRSTIGFFCFLKFLKEPLNKLPSTAELLLNYLKFGVDLVHRIIRPMVNKTA